MAKNAAKSTEKVVPVEQPVPSPNERTVPLTKRPSERVEPAMAPAPGPVDQAPAPKPQSPAEGK